MYKYSNGWVDVKNAPPKKITDLIVYAQLTNGAPVDGTIINSDDFGSPTGGTWNSSPLSITGEPTITATNPIMSGDQAVRASLMNQQIQMTNLDAPSPLNSTVFVPGNHTSFNYQVSIPINFGGSNYTNMQISYFQNSVNSGNEHGFIESFNFDGTFTGTGTLALIFNGNYGNQKVGIRLESSTNQSSIFYVEFNVIQVTDTNKSVIGNEFVVGEGDPDWGAIPPNSSGLYSVKMPVIRGGVIGDPANIMILPNS